MYLMTSRHWEEPTRLSWYSIPELLGWINSDREGEEDQGTWGGGLAEAPTILDPGVLGGSLVFSPAEVEIPLRLTPESRRRGGSIRFSCLGSPLPPRAYPPTLEPGLPQEMTPLPHQRGAVQLPSRQWGTRSLVLFSLPCWPLHQIQGSSPQQRHGCSPHRLHRYVWA